MKKLSGTVHYILSARDFLLKLATLLFICMISCYSFTTEYNREGLIVKSHKTSWSLPTDIEPRIIKHIVRYWDREKRLTRLDEQRTAVAIATGLSKHGYVKWFCFTNWFEIFVEKGNQDRLVSRKLDENKKISEEFELNLIEYR